MASYSTAVALAAVASAGLLAQGPAPALAPTGPAAVRMPYADARPVLDALPDDVPAALRDAPAAAREAVWSAWASRHDAEIRARLERGDEDSLVNLWLFGTSFTDLPPARAADVSAAGVSADLEEVRQRRLDAFVEALRAPEGNDRLAFARAFMADRGLDPATPAGRRGIRARLSAAWTRAVDEFAAYDRTLDAARQGADAGAEVAAYATIFSGRGLSSDTSLLADFAVAQTLRSLGRNGILRPGSVRRVAIVGPGLDFINKADGHDFYPEQTIQPFALVDSLLRLGLARTDDLRVTTLDLSPRVNHHLAAAIRRAGEGGGYTLYLPLPADEHWEDGLVRFWEELGDRIGEEVAPAHAPVGDGTRVRAVRVRPEVARSLVPVDLDIVVERLDVSEPFDLVVGTNVFVYYDAFEQALAVANVASMLRPGGVLVSNTLLLPTPPMKGTAAHAVIRYSDRQYDHMFWYQRAR